MRTRLGEGCSGFHDHVSVRAWAWQPTTAERVPGVYGGLGNMYSVACGDAQTNNVQRRLIPKSFVLDKPKKPRVEKSARAKETLLSVPVAARIARHMLVCDWFACTSKGC